ncbi:hypothetical protein GCM10023194_47880 [Planotetraspora phitsanulokensis]|uniref:Uncharacterized protein n=1 Tax=Planotetraspora phitsanulokensis TaxID=575192 RepID=A0A8J3TZM6_9ACTN|nr:hypothetical protein Pph01_05620 [Planotetraspora phitsanulokensis]
MPDRAPGQRCDENDRGGQENRVAQAPGSSSAQHGLQYGGLEAGGWLTFRDELEQFVDQPGVCFQLAVASPASVQVAQCLGALFRRSDARCQFGEDPSGPAKGPR